MGQPVSVPIQPEALRRVMSHHDGPVVAYIVGSGAAGGVLAKELAEAGMSVVVLEAGEWLDTRRDYVNDELSMLGRFDWDDLRTRTGGSAYAAAFFTLVAELGVAETVRNGG